MFATVSLFFTGHHRVRGGDTVDGRNPEMYKTL